MSITHVLQLLYLGTLLATAAYVLPRGGHEERWSYLWLAACSVGTFMFESPKSIRWHHAEFVVMSIDAALLVAMATIMLRSQRLWLIPAVAFQLVAVITHVAMLINPAIVPRVYSWAQGFWAYPIMALIAAGTARRHRLSAPGAVSQT